MTDACAWTARQIVGDEPPRKTKEAAPEKIHGQPYLAVRAVADCVQRRRRATVEAIADDLNVEVKVAGKYLKAAVKAGWVRMEEGLKRENQWAVAA